MNEFELRALANESICWEKIYSARTEQDRTWWMNELGKLMKSEAVKRQSEQQPAHVGGCVSAPQVEHKPEEVKQDEFNGMNGVCCK